MRIVLSHPYAGALHWWFQSSQQHAHDKRPDHPYYRHLYGDIDEHLDVTLACTVVFDEVLMQAADAYYPSARPAKDNSGVRVPELDVTAVWQHEFRDRDKREDLRELAADAQIASILRRVPLDVRPDVIADALGDAALSIQYNAPIVSSPGRRAVMLRLSELGAITTVPKKVPWYSRWRAMPTQGEQLQLGAAATAKLDAYVTVTALTFRSRDAAALGKVKQNKTIRTYAGEFERVLTRTGSSSEELFESMASAWGHRQIFDEVGGGLATASRGLGLAAFVPLIGLPAGVSAVALDAAAMATNAVGRKRAWYELGAEITHVETVREMESLLRSRGLIA